MKKSIFDYLIIFIGAVIYSLSVVIFTAPNNIAPGGLTGIATVANYLFGAPIGTVIFILNIPLFIWGAIEKGVSFLGKTVFGTLALSAAIDLLGLFTPVYTGDRMLASVFGGILNGAGLGLIFYRGGSTGGTDIISLIVHKRFPHITTGTVIMACDALSIAVAALAYGSIESALYAVIAIFVSIKIIDAMTYGFSGDNGKLMLIITAKPEEITAQLFNTVRRGVTLISSRGGYSKDEKTVILCALRPRQVHTVITLVKALDEKAFTVVTTANIIKGEGFKS